MRTRGGCVVHRCQNKNLIERLTSWCEWRHALEVRVWRILGILKKSVELSPASGKDGWLLLARGGLGQVPHEMGCRWKSQNRKNVYLSPYVEEPLNSKVIKSFIPELRSCKCFLCFEILCSIYIYIYMNIWCPFRISVSGYGT